MYALFIITIYFPLSFSELGSQYWPLNLSFTTHAKSYDFVSVIGQCINYEYLGIKVLRIFNLIFSIFSEIKWKFSFFFFFVRDFLVFNIQQLIIKRKFSFISRKYTIPSQNRKFPVNAERSCRISLIDTLLFLQCI